MKSELSAIRKSQILFFIKTSGPSGNRTRVLGFEAQEDILYPMDPAQLLNIKRY